MRRLGYYLILALMMILPFGCAKHEQPSELMIFADHSGSVDTMVNYYKFAGRKIGEILGYFPENLQLKIYHYAANIKLAESGSVKEFKNDYLLPSVLTENEKRYTLHSQILNIIALEKTRNNVIGAIVVSDGRSAPPKPLKDIEFTSISDSISLPVLWVKPDSEIVLLNGNIEITNPSIQKIKDTFGIREQKISTWIIVLIIVGILLIIGGVVAFIIIRKKKKIASLRNLAQIPKFTIIMGEDVIPIYKNKAIIVNMQITPQQKNDPKAHYVVPKQYISDDLYIEIERTDVNKSYKITNNSAIKININVDGRTYVIKPYNERNINVHDSLVIYIFNKQNQRIDICKIK